MTEQSTQSGFASLRSGMTRVLGAFMQTPREPQGLARVLWDELVSIRERRRILSGGKADAPTEQGHTIGEFQAAAHETKDLSALSLSGGGIRSAAFGLGVIQGLALRGLLHRFDYLSTVSGGGYIGSWLTAWVQRQGYDAVREELIAPVPPDRDKSPLHHLRRYSSYLTPRSGLMSSDMLAVAMLYLRNLLLNWLVIVPLLVVVILLVKLAAVEAWRMRTGDLTWALAMGAVALTGLALVDSLRQRPGWETSTSDRVKFTRREVMPMAAGVFLASLSVLQFLSSANNSVLFSTTAFVLAPIGALLFGAAWLVAFYFAKPSTKRAKSTRTALRADGSLKSWAHVFGAAVAFLVAGAATGVAIAAAVKLASLLPHGAAQSVGILIGGPPLILAAFYVGEVIYTGLTSGQPWADGEREWLARASGYHARAGSVWAISCALVLLGPAFIGWLYEQSQAYVYLLGSTGGAAGAVVALIGKASTTAAQARDRARSLSDASIDVILAIAMPVFVGCTIMFLSLTLDVILSSGLEILPPGEVLWPSVAKTHHLVGSLLAMLVIALLTATAFSIFVNINRFSLHGVYRNRLVRAFLGASNAERNSNPFIDFDERDNKLLRELWPTEPLARNDDGSERIPPQLHVINMALNVVATAELAWQERKALSFTATSQWVGSGALGAAGFYRPAKLYGKGMSLGTAMTISGAAASPNMGYHSSPALGVLLTAFNVRLGAWLGNPGPAGASTFEHDGPYFSAMPLINEAFGRTTDSRKYVYLSDGGHFENLGIYEMIRRRCQLIVVSDAGCDPKYTFEDLGNAVRKISIDLGVKIVFEAINISGREDAAAKGAYCAVATIQYPERKDTPGLLLYLKPSLLHREPPSVTSYALAHAGFPHESTADQWFAESQFEAYRALGEHVVASISPSKPNMTIREFIEGAAARLNAVRG